MDVELYISVGYATPKTQIHSSRGIHLRSYFGLNLRAAGLRVAPATSLLQSRREKSVVQNLTKWVWDGKKDKIDT